MKRTDVVIVGGGQAGLAMSRCLTDEGIEHVVLERGRVAERWRSERWDSLRLLTPSWQSRLPGWRYRGSEPDGFMTMPEVIGYFERYAGSFAAPVLTETTVHSVERRDHGYRVLSDRGEWLSDSVVVATGATGAPNVPSMAASFGAGVFQIVPTRYKNPGDLPDGGVLVVGASASGLQLAEEIHASGRPVTLSVGRHTRLPRIYRGRDIMWWLDRMGALDERADEVRDIEASRRSPSMQLVGSSEHRSIDLTTLAAQGVRLVGRTLAVREGQIQLADDLARTTAAADEKLARLLDRIDRFAGQSCRRERPPKLEIPVTPAEIDLERDGIRSVLWATGFRESNPWLKVPVTDERGRIEHHDGVTRSPGLYVLGLRFLRKRNSNFIDGVGDDARALADHIAARLHGPRSAAA
jgi:putative flavoprotein involved in K+ transport